MKPWRAQARRREAALAKPAASSGGAPRAAFSSRDAARRKTRARRGEERRNQAPALATLAGVLWQAWKKDDALKTFKQLRELSAQLDLDVPSFAQLALLAQELRLPADWRVPLKFPADSGTRPEFASARPVRWLRAGRRGVCPRVRTARSARELSRAAGARGLLPRQRLRIASSSFNVFAPMARDSPTTGISDRSGERGYGGRTVPHSCKQRTARGSFPSWPDPELTAFKAYRAFDDFEQIPLHGTFLVDAAGLVRWQDISYEPFRDAKWLLAESKRLLCVPMTIPATAGR